MDNGRPRRARLPTVNTENITFVGELPPSATAAFLSCLSLGDLQRAIKAATRTPADGDLEGCHSTRPPA